MAHTLRSVFLSKLIHFLPITMSLTEFFLQRDIKNQGFIKSWHQGVISEKREWFLTESDSLTGVQVPSAVHIFTLSF